MQGGKGYYALFGNRHMKLQTKNRAASIRQRLLNHAKNNNRTFNEILQYYAMERFLYRLSISSYAKHFILKGGLVLYIWNAPASRPTMDIDMLGRTSNEVDRMIKKVKAILAAEVIEDGLVFNIDTIQAERITEDADYEGIRVRFIAILETARIHLQIDIGFGDIVYPSPEESLLPTLLEFPAPKLLAYSPESVIAEKFEAMIKLGVVNSRMKDFYDIWMLSQQFNFKGAQLAEAIRLTFNQRDTELPMKVEAFKEPFIRDKQIQWSAFCKRLGQAQVPTEFSVVVFFVSKFLLPLLHALNAVSTMPNIWIASGEWS